MPDSFIGRYRHDIMDQLRCSAADAAMVEEIMRHHVFHSTLDWQSAAELQRGASEARALLEEDRELFEGRYRDARTVFEEMKRRDEMA